MSKAALYLSFLTLASVAFAQDALPGAINCTEGHVTLDGQPVPNTPEPIEIAPGHTLATEQGRAEILLTPGVFVRIAENSSVKMDAVSDHEVKLELVRGEALVEVAEVSKTQRVDIIDQGADARLDHDGLFLFNASRPEISAYSGKTHIDDDRRIIALNSGEAMPLKADGALRPHKFDRAETDAIFAWSAQRAGADSQIAEWTSEAIPAIGEETASAPGWHWSPWYRAWAFVPASRYVVTPFGYGYYAPSAPHDQTPVFGDFRQPDPGNRGRAR